MILFSIVVPVYNSEKYLRECIESVLNQTYRNFEIVLVDDGSTDASREICDLYSKQYDCITTLHQKNRGPIEARVNGVSYAKGDFLFFLDSDDMLRIDALEIIEQAITNNCADLVMFCASTKKEFNIPFKHYPFKTNQVFCGTNKGKLYELICTSSLINELALKCFRTSIFSYIVNNEEDGKVRNGDDCLLSLPIIDKATTIVFIDELIYYYRPNEHSIVHVSNPKCFDSYRIVTERRLSYAAKWDVACPGLLDKAEQFAGEQCYTAVRNVMNSEIRWKEKHDEINRIKKSEFYTKYHKLLPKGFSYVKRIFYYMWLSNNRMISGFATRIYKILR